MRIQSLILSASLLGVAVVATGQTAPRAPASSAAAEIAQGRRLYIRCAACHAIAPTNQAKIGPHLQGIVGRRAASVAGFNYSSAMRNANIRWDEATLDRWLQRPQAVVPGTTMAFAGIANPADRRALIAYMRRPN
ncbi:c-type cytochrome [Sphingomonas lacunae]|uniref:c-type cytochrome n=1 Tax=Sphingomonas lacunae TaxID=2698828 RepID=UPI001BAF220F|nr:cytochrome c family protein [Sphingomonas lacunae]